MLAIKITHNMHMELTYSEVDPFRDDHDHERDFIDCHPCGGEPDWARDQMVSDIERAARLADTRTIEVTEKTASAWAWALISDIDKWSDWGRDGSPFVRAGRRMLALIQDAYPDAYVAGYNRINGIVA